MAVKQYTHQNDSERTKKRTSKPVSQNTQAVGQSGLRLQRVRLHSHSLTPEDVLQLQSAIGNRAVGRLLSKVRPGVEPAHAAKEPTPNRTGLPDDLKAGIENLSGLSMDDVRVHYNSPKPAEFAALAYTQGTEIHVAPGQEKHLPHEAWHVVQQKHGRVKPMLQVKGVAINVDAGLEHEAWLMGAKVSQMPSSVLGATRSALQQASDTQVGADVSSKGIVPSHEKAALNFLSSRLLTHPGGGATPSLQLMQGAGEVPTTWTPIKKFTQKDLRDTTIPRGDSTLNITKVVVRKMTGAGNIDNHHWWLFFEVQNQNDLEWMQVDLTLNDGYRIILGAGFQPKPEFKGTDDLYTGENLTRETVTTAVKDLAKEHDQYYNPDRKSAAYKPDLEHFRYSCQTFVTKMIKKLNLKILLEKATAYGD